jgi:transcription elongation factor SPT5
MLLTVIISCLAAAPSPYLPGTPGGPPMTPGVPSYLPGTPGGQPMTPGTGALDPTSPAIGAFIVLERLNISVQEIYICEYKRWICDSSIECRGINDHW